MRNFNKRTRRTAAAGMAGMTVFATILLGADGCASDVASDPTPVQTFKITPAADATAAPSPDASRQAPSPTNSAPAPGGSEPIAISGISSEFDLEEVSAPPGRITVEFDNRDAGVIHNIHFFAGTDNDGESVTETELEVGPIKQTLTFNVEAGEYFYQCDAHPTTMEGILRVE
jgi:plastocyanin